MARKFAESRAKMSPEAQARSAAWAEAERSKSSGAAHKWSELETQMGSERVAASSTRARKIIEEMPLGQNRNASTVKQTRKAERKDS